jgi:hypothetical protein
MTVTPVRTHQPGNTFSTVWNLTTDVPLGLAESVPGASDRSVHVIATETGGATLVVEGSNEDTPVNWVALKDSFGDVLSFTDTDAASINDNMLHIRVRLSTVGTGADWKVVMLSRSTR